ncbi:MAG: hypothetical protein U0872_14735 [Planctomycetaceae bacterium]
MTVLLGILVVLLLAAIGISVRPASRPGTDKGQAVAAEFLRQIQQAELESAWESTTAEFKSAQGQEAFQRKVRRIKFLREPLEFVSVQVVSLGTETRHEYHFGSPDGKSVQVVLGREDGLWKVDHWSFSP